MKAIICETETEFEGYEEIAKAELKLPSEWHQDYATIADVFPVFPVLSEVAHLFTEQNVIDYVPEEETEDDG
jgi:hypothetical protein